VQQRKAASIVATLAMGLVSEVVANTPQAGVSRTYPLDYFQTFAPKTALDIVARIPGFSIDYGSDVRGFAGGASNVLIDGVRPTSKSGGLREALARLPAEAVERIDMLDASQLGSESGGQGIVANVVRKESGRSGTWLTEAFSSRSGQVSPRIEANLSQSLGEWRTSTRLDIEWSRDPNSGSRIRTAASGLQTLVESEGRDSLFGNGSLSGEARRTLAGGILSVNGRVERARFERDTDRLGFAGTALVNGAPQLQAVSYAEETTDFELGADWSRTLGNDWSAKALVLATQQSFDAFSESYTQQPLGTVAFGSASKSDREKTEWIGRVTFAATGDRPLRPEVGVEAAFNRLDSRFNLQRLDSSGTLAQVQLPAANVVVSETRIDAFANLNWNINERWTATGGVGAESSEISVSGDASNRDSYVFLKPTASLTWRVNPRLEVRATVRRTAGQLDFESFAASAELASEREFGGNPRLRPDQATRAELSLDARRESGRAISVSAFHEWQRDVLEQVVLPSSAVGVGNAGDARLWGMNLAGTVPLEFVLPGLKLEATGEWRSSAFDDPVTGTTRDLTALVPWQYRTELRQDVRRGAWAWGVVFEDSGGEVAQFVSETFEFNPGRSIDVYVESGRVFGMKARFEVSKVGRQDFRAERTFYAPSRAGPITGLEVRRFDVGPFYMLRFEGNL
jgi:hypothetical protein